MNGYCSFLCYVNALPICKCGKVTPMKPEFVRNPYNYDSDELSNATGLLCLDPSLTQQQFVEESDINYIAEQFMKTGQVKVIPDMPTPGDFEGIFDFQTAMNTIVQAKQEFMTLPAKIRSRFDNDPAKLLAFLDNMSEDDRSEAEAIGLVKRREPREPGTEGVHEQKSQSKTRTAGTESDARGPQPSEKPGPEARQDGAGGDRGKGG